MPCGEYFTHYEERNGLFRWRIQRIALLGLPIPFLLPFVIGGGIVSLLSQMYIFAIAVLGLNVILGYAGEIVLAQGAFMAIGAYTTINVINAGLGMLPALLISGLVVALVAVLFGIPSFRVKGFYIAITTLALQFITEWFFNNNSASWIHGGPRQAMPAEVGLVGEFLTVGSRLSLYFLTLGLMIVFAMLSLNLSRTGIARAFRAVHDNDLAASVLGIDVFRNKLLAFAVGGFMIGVSGGLFGFYIGFLDPSYFTIDRTLQQYVMLLFGGLGRVWGALLGVGIVIIILEFLRSSILEVAPNATTLEAPIFGVLIILVLAVEPKGFLAALGQIKEYLQKWPYAY